MPTNWQPSNKAARKDRFWNTSPPNVTEQARQAGRAHFNRSLHAVLMPQSVMPIGPHTGKLMERVPPDYLAWVQAQPWAADWHPWHPVADYLTRFPTENSEPRTENNEWPSHICTVTPMQACAPTQDWTYPEHALLRCHRDTWLHEDKYHTFALGALGLRPPWFDPKLQAYRLTAQKRHRAIQLGAGELAPSPRQQRTANREQPFQRLTAEGRPLCTKTHYSSKTLADQVIADRMKSHRNRPDFLRSYLCPRCHLYHLTKQP